MVAVSVVVPSRGGRERLPLLLASLATQEFDDFEVVVVLDGDIDGSEVFLAATSCPFEVRVVTFPENQGRSAALNAGFAAARGEVFVRCDDDLHLRPDALRLHVEHHRSAQGPVGVVGLYRNLYTESAYARHYGRPRDLDHRRSAYSAPSDRRWLYWAGWCSVTAETYATVGDYDTEIFRRYGWEDVDWGYRLHRAGVGIDVLPGLEVEHHVAAIDTTSRMQRAYDSGAAQYRFETKHQLPRMTPPPDGPWGAVVGRLARGLNPNTLPAYGRRAEWVAARTPHRIAEKTIAACVEAAALRGYEEAARGAR